MKTGLVTLGWDGDLRLRRGAYSSGLVAGVCFDEVFAAGWSDGSMDIVSRPVVFPGSISPLRSHLPLAHILFALFEVEPGLFQARNETAAQSCTVMAFLAQHFPIRCLSVASAV